MRTLVNCLAAVILLAMSSQATAAIMKTKGIFRGVYHENVAGVGCFEIDYVFSEKDHYLVASDIRRRLAPYDGKYIELEVLDSNQWSNPGAAIITRIGKIKELPPAPIEINIETVSPDSDGPASIDVLFTYKNVGKKPLHLDVDRVGFGGFSYRSVDNPDEVDSQFGYTRRQLNFRGGCGQVGLTSQSITIVSVSPVAVTLEPGEVAPFVRHGLHLKRGKYELAASTLFWRDNERIPVIFWKPLEVPLPANQSVQTSGLAIRAKVTAVENRLRVEGRLFNTTSAPCHIFVRPDGDHFILPGIVWVYDSKDNRFNWIGKFRTSYKEQVSVRRPVDREGIPFHLNVSSTDEFSDVQPRRIEIWIVTDNGLDKLIVSKDLPRLDLLPVPPWGPEVDECRCRMRPTKKRFAPDEPMRFLFQVAISSEKRGVSKMLKIKRGGMTVEIDGRETAIFSTTLREETPYGLSCKGSFELPPAKTLASGKHSVRLMLRGKGGTYTYQPSAPFHSDERPITWRLFNGVLPSNSAEFEVSE